MHVKIACHGFSGDSEVPLDMSGVKLHRVDVRLPQTGCLVSACAEL